MISSTAAYYARDWAEGKTVEEIKAEISYLNGTWTIKNFTHPGNANMTYSREVTLQKILLERSRK